MTALPSDPEAPAGGPDGQAEVESVVRSLERSILLCGAVAVALLLLLSRRAMVPGALCGVALAWLNFRFLRAILGKAFAEGGAARKRFAVQYVLKFLGYAALVYLAVASGWFSVGGFLVGLSSLVAAFLLEGLLKGLAEK
jgi:hypothetical protein